MYLCPNTEFTSCCDLCEWANVCQRARFPFRDPLAWSFLRYSCSAVCFGCGLWAQSWKWVSCCHQWLQIGQEMENWMSISYCLQLCEVGKKGSTLGTNKKTLGPFWIPVDTFKPERTDCLDQQKRRLVRSATDSPPANTNPALSFIHIPTPALSLPVSHRNKMLRGLTRTLHNQRARSWGVRSGERERRSERVSAKDERWGDSCCSASLGLSRRSLSPLPAAPILKINSVSGQNKEIVLFWQMLWGIALGKNYIKAYFQ